MAKFKAFPIGSYFLFVIAALIVAACVFVVADKVTMQTLVVGGMVAAASVGIGIRYYQYRRGIAVSFVAYNQLWDYNVFCLDAHALVRWNFGVNAEIARAVADVANRLECPTFMDGLTFRIVSEPFRYPRLEGLNSGVYDPNTHQITISWPSGAAIPPTLYHELLHVPIALKEMIDGSDAAHARMRELAKAGTVPASWC
jgi:hypothetical protein